MICEIEHPNKIFGIGPVDDRTDLIAQAFDLMGFRVLTGIAAGERICRGLRQMLIDESIGQHDVFLGGPYGNEWLHLADKIPKSRFLLFGNPSDPMPIKILQQQIAVRQHVGRKRCLQLPLNETSWDRICNWLGIDIPDVQFPTKSIRSFNRSGLGEK